MPAPRGLPLLGSLALIAVVIGVGAAAFGYTAGWFSPRRLTPDKLVAAFAPPTGPALGHRRNHAKGICFTGVFLANGAGSELSRAQVFARGSILPVVRPLRCSRHARCRRRGSDGSVPGLRHLDRDAGRTGVAQRHDQSAGVYGVDTASVLRIAARVTQQGPERNARVCRRPSGIRDLRRLGQERTLDRQLRRRTLQRPRQLCRSSSTTGDGAADRLVAVRRRNRSRLYDKFLPARTDYSTGDRQARAPQRSTM